MIKGVSKKSLLFLNQMGVHLMCLFLVTIATNLTAQEYSHTCMEAEDDFYETLSICWDSLADVPPEIADGSMDGESMEIVCGNNRIIFMDGVYNDDMCFFADRNVVGCQFIRCQTGQHRAIIIGNEEYPKACVISIDDMTMAACNSSGSPTDASDDFVEFDLLVNGENVAESYMTYYSVNELNYEQQGLYGQWENFTLAGEMPAEGMEITVMVADMADPTCMREVTGMVYPTSCLVNCPDDPPNTLCSDGTETITLTADAGTTNVVWYNSNDEEIGMGSPIQITISTNGLSDETETFYYTADDTNGCAAQLCCPITVNIIDCCPVENCFTATVTQN